MTQSEAKKPKTGVLVGTIVGIAVLVVAVIMMASASHTALDGKWLRVNAKDGTYPGDYIMIKGSSWEMTGNPAMSGTVKNEGGKISLHIDQIGDQTRVEAIKANAAGFEERLKALDEQLVFEVEEQKGRLMLIQKGLSS